jgi:hypothetical protein
VTKDPESGKAADWLEGETTSESTDQTDLAKLSPTAAQRIRRFVAESLIKGGASPSDVADLYTASEVIDDAGATQYLDQRYVHGTVPTDWRALEDRLTAAYFEAPPGVSGMALLQIVERADERTAGPRSIFDDPLDWDDDRSAEERGHRLVDRDPSLSDLSEEGRRQIEHHVVADVLNYGLPPIRTVELRDALEQNGDERSLQYLDLPHERAERPPDWDELRDRALRLRARLEARGRDSSELLTSAQSTRPDLDAAGLLGLLEEGADRR